MALTLCLTERLAFLQRLLRALMGGELLAGAQKRPCGGEPLTVLQRHALRGFGEGWASWMSWSIDEKAALAETLNDGPVEGVEFSLDHLVREREAER